eukprot:440090_1
MQPFYVLVMYLVTISFGAHRLMPTDNSVIHCAGQSPEDFYNYSMYLDKNTLPAMYMTYMDLNTTVSDINTDLTSLNNLLKSYPSYQWLSLQIGLEFNGIITNVINGEYDAQINALIYNLETTLSRPVWLRIGYEFNGQWNDYPKKQYISAYIHITNMLRQ